MTSRHTDRYYRPYFKATKKRNIHHEQENIIINSHNGLVPSSWELWILRFKPGMNNERVERRSERTKTWKLKCFLEFDQNWNLVALAMVQGVVPGDGTAAVTWYRVNVSFKMWSGAKTLATKCRFGPAWTSDGFIRVQTFSEAKKLLGVFLLDKSLFFFPLSFFYNLFFFFFFKHSHSQTHGVQCQSLCITITTWTTKKTVFFFCQNTSHSKK